MMKTRTRGKGTIDRGLRGSMGTLDDVNPTRLSKRSQSCPLIETAFEYKYQIAMETAERNTSKQVSAKETVLWNVYKYSRIIIIFFCFFF